MGRVYLPSKHGTVSSNPSTEKKRKKSSDAVGIFVLFLTAQGEKLTKACWACEAHL
jgi:hypothetical protein